MASVNVDKLIAGLKDYFVQPKMLQLIEDFKAAGVLKKITIGVSIALYCIVVVEHLAADLGDLGVPGSEKKEALVKFLDDSVDVPFYLEPVDGLIMGIAIDAFVGWLNLTKGHAWLAALKEFLGADDF